MKKLISCIVPIYNEEAIIVQFIDALMVVMNTFGFPYEIIIVDDGSTDKTSEILSDYHTNPSIRYLKFSRNFGKEKALSAGLDYAKGDAVILMDADFQHPLDMLSVFIEKWQQGADMVYAYRENRQDEALLKRIAANLFYRFTTRINRFKIPANAGDFRLLDKKIVDAIKSLPERNRFMKGLYSWVGFNQVGVPYAVQPRLAGQSRWNYMSLLDLAITGITSFSSFPLRLIALGGMGISFFALSYALWIIISTLCFGVITPGWATIVTVISFFGGLQIFAIGAVGEYIGRIFDEVKMRPLYLLDKTVSFNVH